MAFAEIDISIPGDAWMFDVSTAYPDVPFTILSTQYGTDTGIALVEIRMDNPGPTISDIGRQDDVVDFELLWKRDTETVLQIETREPALLEFVGRAGVPLQTPFTVSNGTASWQFLTSRSRLSELCELLDAAGITYELRTINDRGGAVDRLLTDRQREVLHVAYEAGYYDTPREATLTEVARILDVSKATCSDVLHRAEGKIVDAFVDDRVTNE